MVEETENIIKLLAQAIDSGTPAAFVTLISSSGSVPGAQSSKMLVYEDGSSKGTVGGGSIEAMVIKQAVACLGSGTGGKFDFELTAAGNTKMICGGKAEVYIDVYSQPVKLLILGGGHVGQKIAEVCRTAGFPYKIADERQEFANRQRFPHASEIINELPYKAVERLAPGKDTYIVIVTRGHSLDKECLEASLKTDAAYIGMIGSASKVRETFRIFAEKGIHPEKDPRVYSPIGLRLGGKTPGEIAVSVLSEIIKVHYRKDGGHMKLAE